MVEQAELGLNFDPDYHLIGVPPNQVSEIWDYIRPVVMEGKKYWEDYTTVEQLYKDITQGKFQCWIVINEGVIITVFLTEIIEYPKKRVLSIVWICGSELDKYLECFLSYLEVWAVNLGVSSAMVTGRRGWIRKLRPLGYTQERIIVEKSVTDIRIH